jgi:hypothetical protein
MDSDIEVGLTSWALWSAANRRWRSRSVAVLITAFLAAVGLHATWDYVNTLVSYALIGVASLSLLSWATRAAAAENAPCKESPRSTARAAR